MSTESRAPLPQRVLVTGASRGIGRAIARALSLRGARLALVGRDRAALESVTSGVAEHALLVADLAQPGAGERCVDRACDALGGLDALVCSAGVVEYQAIGAIDRAALERQLTLNASVPFMMAQRALDPIARAGGGAMLFIASTLGLKPEAPLTSAYAASKAALISLTRSLALELGPRAIRVHAIAPGVIDTDMARTLREPAASLSLVEREAGVARQIESLRRLHPLGRLGTPEDVAETALYLLAAPFVTGAVVAVDGGLLLGQGSL
jgi:NAD(P)-dependent dehydrogenase (short-subunit alcohol dehydrogenase family)